MFRMFIQKCQIEQKKYHKKPVNKKNSKVLRNLYVRKEKIIQVIICLD